MRSLTVGKEYQTVAETLDAIAYDEEAVVHIPGGVYHEKIFSKHRNLSIIGDGEKKTSVIFEHGSKEDGDVLGSYAACFLGERLEIRDMNISNYAGVGFQVGSAIALSLDVRHAHLSHVRLNSFKHTFHLARGSEVVIEHSSISGDAGYVFGGGEALFNDCEFSSIHPGFVFSPRPEQGERGFVCFMCRFKAQDSSCPPQSVDILNPLRGKVTTISCSFGPHVKRVESPFWDHMDLYAKDNTMDEKSAMALVGSFKA